MKRMTGNMKDNSFAEIPLYKEVAFGARSIVHK